MAMNNTDFCIFILTHGRPDRVYTYDTIRKYGYTGKIYLIIDNEDETAEEYFKKYKNEVIMFNKDEVGKTFDMFDNFDDKRGVIYARNSCFQIANDLGITYFMQLDDDYTGFYYKLFIDKGINQQVKNLDSILDTFIDYFKTIDAKSITFAQGGDFIGGIDNGSGLFRFSKRKAMNTFLCSTERPFKFIGRINEDVNVYTWYQSMGNLFLTHHNIAVIQKQTQSNKKGMTDLYLTFGTYVKSFYSVISMPSAVYINLMKTSNGRLHHAIDWECAVPLIIDEKYKKK